MANRKIKRKNTKKSSKNKKELISKKDKKELQKEIKEVNFLANKGSWIAIIIFIAIIGIIAYVMGNNQTHNPAIKQIKADKMNVYVFGDYECPYTKKALDTIEKINNDYGNRVNLRFKLLPLPFHEYAMNASIAAECAKKQGKFNEFTIAALKATTPLNNNKILSIAKQLNLNLDQFKKCYVNQETKDSVEKDIELAQGLGIGGTPTFIIGDHVIPGAIPFNQLKPILDKQLSEFNGTNKELKIEKVDGIIIYAKECNNCNNDQLINTFKKALPFVTYQIYELNSEKAQALIKKYNFESVPQILFSKNIENSLFWKSNPQIPTLFNDLGDYYSIKLEKITQSTPYYLDPEKRKEIEELPKKILGINNANNKTQIDFFVMSFCPYGNIAENAIANTYDLLKNYVKYVPRYIIYPSSTYRQGCLEENGTYYCSLHGEQELHQDIRELCVYHNYNIKKYFDFIVKINSECNPSNADSCWINVAKQTEINVTKIQQCFDINKVKYIKNEVKVTQALQVSGSPTVFINGMQYNGQRTAESYKNALCNAMKNKPSVCETTLNNKQTAPNGSC